MSSRIVFILALSCCVYFAEAKLYQQYNELQFNTNSLSHKRSTSGDSSIKSKENKFNENESNTRTESDDRLLISEPYKSLIQTSARVALTNTEFGRRFNVDVAMNFLNDAGYLLAKPIILITALKVITALIGTISLGIFFLPGVPQFLDAAWRNPIKTFGLKKYMSNGLYDKSIINVLSMRSQELVARIGLDDDVCKQKSICHGGELIKRTAPQMTKSIVDFLKENFSNIQLPDNQLIDSFVSGLVDGDCKQLTAYNETSKETSVCLGNFMDTFMITTGLRHK